MQFQRQITSKIEHVLSLKKSIFLLGPRQTGKTTLIESTLTPDISYSMLIPSNRRRFDQRPEDLMDEIQAYSRLHQNKACPVVYIDEIQLVPELMDIAQYLIDKQWAQFVLTGSSARKLIKRKEGVNLLPGRLIDCRLDALSIDEMGGWLPPLEDLLANGSMPEIIQQANMDDKDQLLTAYVNLYIEQEVRLEALVRDLAKFTQFLTMAAIESGQIINVSKIASDIGVSRNTIDEYFQVLEDCLIIEKIEAVTKSTGRKRLAKSPKYLFFDMGIRRLSAREVFSFPAKYLGTLFEHFVGIEILKTLRLDFPLAKLRYFKDHAGPEVDYVIEYDGRYLPIEVKYTDNPTAGDAKHLKVFMGEYECLDLGLVICRVPRAKMIADRMIALPWQEMSEHIKHSLREM